MPVLRSHESFLFILDIYYSLFQPLYSSWLMTPSDYGRIPAAQLLLEHRPAIVKAVGADVLRQVIAGYGSRYPGQGDKELGLTLFGDIIFRIPQIRLAEALQAQGVPNWMYLFTWPSPVGQFRAAHSMDMPFAFFTQDHADYADFTGPDAPAQLAELMQDTFVSFMRTGTPSHAKLPEWPTYEPRRRATMRLDLEPRLLSDPYAEDRKAWDGVPFDGMSPALEWNPKCSSAARCAERPL